LTHYFCEHHKPEGAVKVLGFKPESKIKKFLPLIIIFSSIALFTVVATYLHGFSWEFAMRMMMGSFFLIFGAFKVFNLKAFADAYSTYDIVAMRSRAYAFTYPFLELLLAVLYLSDIGGIYRDIFTFVLMSVSTIGVVIKLRQREEIPCACLGMVFKIPMTWVTLIEDVLMALEALAMILLALK
jgi:hypothetical protein